MTSNFRRLIECVGTPSSDFCFSFTIGCNRRTVWHEELVESLSRPVQGLEFCYD